MSVSVSRTGPGMRLARHRHARPYAALVLAGGYVEAGDAGRFGVGPGEVLFHDCYEAHGDAFGAVTTALIDLPLAAPPPFARGHVADVDEIVRLAETDLARAADRLLATVIRSARCENDWPDRLAADLVADRVPSLAAWADGNGLRAGSLSRGFGRAYGVTPQRFWLEHKARRAAVAITGGDAPLAAIAFETGFADQAHMSRTVRAITGQSPSALRRASVYCVQEPAKPPR